MHAKIRKKPEDKIILQSDDGLTAQNIEPIGARFAAAIGGGETFWMQGTDGRKVWIGTGLLNQCTLSFEGPIVG